MLIQKLLIQKGKKLMLAGGPDDSECIEIIRNYLSQKGLPFEDYYGKTRNLKDLAELIAKAEQFVCSDSAPLHIAVALKTKTYVIFGPTDDKKLIPQSELVIPIKADDNCPLKPCLWERRKTTCSSLDCLKISAQDIVNKILYIDKIVETENHEFKFYFNYQGSSSKLQKWHPEQDLNLRPTV